MNKELYRFLFAFFLFITPNLSAASADNRVILNIESIKAISIFSKIPLLDFSKARIDEVKAVLSLESRDALLYSYSTNEKNAKIYGRLDNGLTQVNLEVQLESRKGSSKGFVRLKQGSEVLLVSNIASGYEKNLPISVRAELPLKAGPINMDSLGLTLIIRKE